MAAVPPVQPSGNFQWPYRALDSLFNLIFPRHCLVCNRLVEQRQLGGCCADCWNVTQFFDSESSLCNKCGLPAAGPNKTGVTIDCGQCGEHYYDRAFALGPYKDALRATVIEMKTTARLPEVLSSRMGEKVDRSLDLIVPVPLSRNRRFERGFNQAEVIAAELSKVTGRPVDRNSLSRKVHTVLNRAGMDRKKRAKTVERAFAVVRKAPIDGKRILLVDDVFTSGSTASACAEQLLSSGAETVSVFTLARAIIRK
jgi:ComF family protein